MLIWLYCCLCRRTFQMEVEVAALTDSICLIWKCLTKERLRLNGFDDVMNHSDVVAKDSNKALNKIKTASPKAKLVFSSHILFKVYLRWSFLFLYYAYLIILFLQEDAFFEGTSGVCLIWSCPNTETNSLCFESDVVAKEDNKATRKIKKVVNKTKTGFPKAKQVYISLSLYSRFLLFKLHFFYIMLIWLYCFCRRMFPMKVHVVSVCFEVVLIRRY